MAVILKYQGAQIGTINESGTKSLTTAGKYCESDIDVEYIAGDFERMKFGVNRPPDSSLGSNGDYYYQRDKSIRSIKSHGSSLSGGSSIAYGIEFYVTQDVTVTHLCAITTETRVGKLQIGTMSEILAEIENVSFPANTWVEIELSTPIQLTAETHYVVRANMDSVYSTGKIAYAQGSSQVTYQSIVKYVQGRYTNDGSVWPGTAESSSGCLSCLKYLSSDELYKIHNQFYKTAGTWVEI